MQAASISRSQAIVVATAPFVILGIVDGAFREFFKHSPIWFWSFDLLKFLVVPVASLLWLAKTSFVTPEKYGLGAIAEHESWLHYAGLVAFVTAALYFLPFVIVENIAWVLLGRPESEAFYKSMAPSGVLRIPVVLYLAITAGLFEEVFFRALPLLYLRELRPKSLPTAHYVVVSSILFSAVHWENGVPALIGAFVYGLIASVLYLKLRDLWPLVIAHGVIDVIMFW